MNNNELSITCHHGADHAIGHSFAGSTEPGIAISTKEVFVADTIIVPAVAADISDMDNSTNAAYKTCLQKRVDGELDILIDHSNAGKELSDENSGELLASRYENCENINKSIDYCQSCDECDCPGSPVNLKYPKLCGYCAHSGYCQDDCLKEQVPGVFSPCTDDDCRQFRTDECRSCAVIKDELESKVLLSTFCEETESDIPF
jgi:hypothetical protein